MFLNLKAMVPFDAFRTLRNFVPLRGPILRDGDLNILRDDNGNILRYDPEDEE
jgi:hypothetical protein